MKHVICALLVTLAMPWRGKTAVAAYATIAGWNTATAIAVNVSAEKMLSASNAIVARPIITVSALATVASHVTVTWPQKAANATEKRDNANVCQVSAVADAISVFRDIGIMDRTDAHVRLFLFNFYLLVFINIVSKVARLRIVKDL